MIHQDDKSYEEHCCGILCCMVQKILWKQIALKCGKGIDKHGLRNVKGVKHKAETYRIPF